MQLPALQSAKLISRYKRFLADIELPTGDIMTIHCANTGAMTGCGEKRRHKFGIHIPIAKPVNILILGNSLNLKTGQLCCINTHRSNQLVFEALQNKQIKELSMYDEIYPEVKYGEENSRIDFLLKSEGLPDCYVEVKSITLVKGNLGMFPDAVTTRGQKHCP